MKKCVKSEFLPVKGVKHLHDLHLKPGMQKWEKQVALGYEFLLEVPRS